MESCGEHSCVVASFILRRHGRDPRRRKSSIMSRPLAAGFCWSYWTIFSVTTSKPPWPSTVSCPPNPRALPGRLRFPGPWHTRIPRNASCTDFHLRDRRSRPLWGNGNGRLAQRSSGRHAERATSARGIKGVQTSVNLCPPRWRTSAEKRALSPAPLSSGAPARRARRGQRGRRRNA